MGYLVTQVPVILFYPLLCLAAVNKDWSSILFMTMLLIDTRIARKITNRFGRFKKNFIKDTLTFNNNVLIKLTIFTEGILLMIILPVSIFNIFVALGCLLNALPMMLNGGRMPVPLNLFAEFYGRVLETDIDGRIKLDKVSNIDADYCYSGPSTKLAFLGDNFETSDGIISIGDMCFFGAFILSFAYQVFCLIKPA